MTMSPTAKPAPARAALDLVLTTLSWTLVSVGLAALYVLLRPEVPVEQLRPGVVALLAFGLGSALAEWAGWLPLTARRSR
jgi:hypothetical protein